MQSNVNDINQFFDTLREQVLRDKPVDVVQYVVDKLQNNQLTIQKSSNQFDETNAAGDIPAIAPRYPPGTIAKPLTIVVLGATGDLAKKKTFPALFRLFCEGLLPVQANIIGYARSPVSNLAEFRQHFTKFFGYGPNQMGKAHVDHFLSRIRYVQGSYDQDSDFAKLNDAITAVETQQGSNGGNRLFYLALPPTAFVGACGGLSRQCTHPIPADCWRRVIVEKPFGRDTATSDLLSVQLNALFQENQIYRIDHYLGKEMVQNLVTLRFANRVFASLWNNANIANVQITFKEKIGTEGRGGYFDNFGIIRDVVQNHLTQILALVGMEKPRSLAPEHIRDEKVELLKCVQPVRIEDCILGQYTASADGKIPGYLEDPTVPAGSNCPTFAMMKLSINNDRWRGVPFLIKAGKALEAKTVSIRIQFHEEVRPFLDRTQRNELVIRAQPDESMYLKVTTKVPGLGQDTHQTELDLTYHQRYDINLPDAYESLIYEAILGNNTNFVRSDELKAAWEVFTPLLHAIDRGEAKPLPYAAGTRGPVDADKMIESIGFKRYSGYTWQESKM